MKKTPIPVFAVTVLFGFSVVTDTSLSESQSNQPALSAEVEKIAVMPLLRGRCPGILKDTFNCEIPQLTFDPQNLAEGAETTVTRLVHEGLRKRHGERVIQLAQVREAYNGFALEMSREKPRALAKMLGEKLGVKQIMLGTVWRFKERAGGGAGSIDPASVAFTLYIMDVPTAQTVWKGTFDETQRSLSEDVLKAPTFFKRGAKWLSAGEMARFGVEQLLKKSPLAAGGT